MSENDTHNIPKHPKTQTIRNKFHGNMINHGILWRHGPWFAIHSLISGAQVFQSRSAKEPSAHGEADSEDEALADASGHS